MKRFEDAFVELADGEAVYTLLLNGGQARATLRALEKAPDEDGDAAAARDRLARLLET
ncbi:hypothetical protein [Streptomyces sp. NPDC050416]|uniref:hypothetical protein n=1 Tax=Streptomyces sp. NPDC050416 TaxID=3365611 RepID=UPI0037953EE7